MSSVVLIAMENGKPVSFREVPDGLAAMPEADKMRRPGRVVLVANVYAKIED